MGNKNHTAIFPQDLADDSQSSIINQILDPNPKIKQNHVLLAKLTSYIKFQGQLTIKQAKVDGVKNVNLTESIIQIYNHPDFIKSSYSWYCQLVSFLKQLLKKKSMLLISEQEWMCAYGATQFVMLCCDQVIRKTINQSKSFQVKKIQLKEGQVENQVNVYENIQKIQSVQDRLSEKQRKDSKKIIRDFIYYSLKIKKKILPNFGAPFTRIYGSIQCLLPLFTKLEYFQIEKQHVKKDLTICAYAIGLGLDYDHPYIVNLANKLMIRIYRLFAENPKQLTDMKLNPIPNHYFKEIPKFSCKNLHQTVVTYILYILCYKSKNIIISEVTELYMIVTELCKPINKQILYFLQKLSEKQEINVERTNIYYSLILKYSQIHAPSQKLKMYLEQSRNYLFPDTQLQNKISKQTQISELFVSKTEKQRLHKCCYEVVRKIFMENISNKLGGSQCQYQVVTNAKTQYKMKQESICLQDIQEDIKKLNSLSENKYMKKQDHNSSFEQQNQNYSQSQRESVTNFNETEKIGSTDNMYPGKIDENYLQ